MTDLTQSVCAKRRLLWSLPLTGCRTKEIVIRAIYTAGRQANKWWRCVYGIVEVCRDGGGVCRGWWSVCRDGGGV